MLHNSKLQFILIAVLVVALVAPTVMPSPALAQTGDVPTNDSKNIFETALDYAENAVSSGANLADKILHYYQQAQSFIISALKKKIVDYLTEKIIGYTQGGASESPKIVTDWQALLGDARTNSAQSFTSSLAASSVCSPFKKQLLETLGGSGNSNGSGGLDQFKCDFTAGQFNAFNQNFSNGILHHVQETEDYIFKIIASSGCVRTYRIYT